MRITCSKYFILFYLLHCSLCFMFNFFIVSQKELGNRQSLVICLRDDVLMFPAAKIHIHPKILILFKQLTFLKLKISFYHPRKIISLSNKLSSLLTQTVQQKSILFYSKFQSHISSGPSRNLPILEARAIPILQCITLYQDIAALWNFVQVTYVIATVDCTAKISK